MNKQIAAIKIQQKWRKYKLRDLLGRGNTMLLEYRKLLHENIRLKLRINCDNVLSSIQMIDYNGRMDFHNVFMSALSIGQYEGVLFGDFLYKSMISSNVSGTKLRYYFNRRYDISINSNDILNVIHHLQDLKYILSCRENDTHIECIGGSPKYIGVVFSVEIYTKKPKINIPINILNLELGKDGLGVLDIHQSSKIERHRNMGSAILDIISSMRSRRVYNTIRDMAITTNIEDRIRLCCMMESEDKLMKDGFEIIGGSERITNDMCTICLEKDVKNSVKLVCDHAFCVECISRHVMEIGDGHSGCPLCRMTFGLSEKLYQSV